MPMLLRRVALVETSDASFLNELLAAGLRGLVVRQIGQTAVIVDHERLEEAKRLFKRLGQTPRITIE